MGRKYRSSNGVIRKKKQSPILLWICAGVICVFAAVTVGVLMKNGMAARESAESAVPSNASQQSKKPPASSSSPVSSQREDPVKTVSSSADAQSSSRSGSDSLSHVVGTVPESAPVGDDYFDDAVFVGNSRTEMLQLYSNLVKPEFYAVQGMSVDKLHDKPVVSMDGEKLPIMEALKKKRFGKVYIMLGLNELGWVYSDIFIQEYGDAIDEIKQSQPGAVIYVQSILPVSKNEAAREDVFNNKNIVNYNTLIKKMAEEKGVCYLDVAEAVTDSEGNLFEDASTDGIHLTPEYCDVWLDYLKTHTAS